MKIRNLLQLATISEKKSLSQFFMCSFTWCSKGYDCLVYKCAQACRSTWNCTRPLFLFPCHCLSLPWPSTDLAHNSEQVLVMTLCICVCAQRTLRSRTGYIQQDTAHLAMSYSYYSNVLSYDTLNGAPEYSFFKIVLERGNLLENTFH